MTSNSYIFPCDFVYTHTVENHEDIKEKYLHHFKWDAESYGALYRRKSKWRCEVTSSYFRDGVNPLPFLDSYFYDSVVWAPVDAMLKEMGEKIHLPTPKQSTINQLWYNEYHPGNWQEIHNHINVSTAQQFSGIYILDLNEEKNTTGFYSTSTRAAWGDTPFIMHFPDVKEGTVLIFPVELNHFVNPCENRRTTISFNISSDYGTK